MIMECNEDELASDSTFKWGTKMKCKVCGSQPARSNFGAVCCASCKMFFRRNEYFDLNTERCLFGGDCDITVDSRRSCRFCRLEKCFSAGMQQERFRSGRSHLVSSYSRERKEKKRHQIQQTTISDINEKKTFVSKSRNVAPTVFCLLDLLDKDRSLLTTDQWSLLSNVVNSYNAKSPTSDIQQTLTLQQTYAPKVRMKMAAINLKNCISSMFANIFPFVQSIPQFAALSTSDRKALLRRNMKSLGVINGFYICRETDFYREPSYKNFIETSCVSSFMDNAIKLIYRSDIDGTLLKLLLIVLCFSTTFNTLYPPSDESDFPIKYDLLSSSKEIFTIQNMYVDVLFKYMLYRYNYKTASIRFAALIKNVLDQTAAVEPARENKSYEDIIQRNVKEAELTLQFDATAN